MLESGPMGYSDQKAECKPDYERIIRKSKERLAATEKFLDAVFEYNGKNAVRKKMAELVGELYSEKVQLEHHIEQIIRQQEKEG